MENNLNGKANTNPRIGRFANKTADLRRKLASPLGSVPNVFVTRSRFRKLRGVLGPAHARRVQGCRLSAPVVLSAARCWVIRAVVPRLTVLARLRMIWVYRCLACPAECVIFSVGLEIPQHRIAGKSRGFFTHVYVHGQRRRGCGR